MYVEYKGFLTLKGTRMVVKSLTVNITDEQLNSTASKLIILVRTRLEPRLKLSTEQLSFPSVEEILCTCIILHNGGPTSK